MWLYYATNSLNSTFTRRAMWLMDLSTISKCHGGFSALGQEGLMSSEGLTSSETRATLENSLWAAGQLRRSKLAGHHIGRWATVHLTRFMVTSLSRGPLPVPLLPWGTIQLDNVAFSAPRHPSKVILEGSFQPGQCPCICVFPNLFLQEIRVCVIDR